MKTGRTHLMDAMPVTLAQELSAWRAQVENAAQRLRATEPRLLCLAQGGTAVGSGINAHAQFSRQFCAELQRLTMIEFQPNRNAFEALASQDTAVELSGQLKVLAVCLMKIANDLRWMNSGPLAGLGEIALPALQPGSSIMPGKVNPVTPGGGGDGCRSGDRQRYGDYDCGPVGQFPAQRDVAADRLQSAGEPGTAGQRGAALADQAIAGFAVNAAQLAEALERNPMLVTALNPVIGYERGAAIAKRAYAEGRSIREVAAEMSGLTPAELERLLDPLTLTRGGILGGGSGAG